ncbi:conserved hypothetical protein [Vibrio chagasii]|nr:conserved hypothetical protein [Vibrio chagasii]CAH7022106.1 conserved hypothetical protein [Vibrio chagasii]CAH7032397.1 conserved hypothetical protein [Vibrio chagasii]CAH7086671.1 conserved hypothetical protein [Vibrio chagasii]CAH7271965.1 conserved hypothetical protein [Vibrio chagasii]
MELVCKILAWDWGEIIQIATGVGTLVIAWVAMSTWKKQLKVQKVTGLLDELTDAVHEYIHQVSLPTQQLQYIRIAIESMQYDMSLNNELAHPQLVRYIEKSGSDTALKLKENLLPCDSSVNRIRSLIVKAQVFQIEGFDKCFNACQMIVWQYDRLWAIYSMLCSSGMNWEHPDVIKQLGEIDKITHTEIQQTLAEHQVTFLEFVKDTYNEQYKT